MFFSQIISSQKTCSSALLSWPSRQCHYRVKNTMIRTLKHHGSSSSCNRTSLKKYSPSASLPLIYVSLPLHTRRIPCLAQYRNSHNAYGHDTHNIKTAFFCTSF